MIDYVWSWINTGIDASVSWIIAIGDGVGFPLWGYLIAMTITGIVLAYLVIPAVGKSDEAVKPEYDLWYSDYRGMKG